MLIGLDARTIYSANRRGTAKNLIDLYRHVLQQRKDWRCVAYHRNDGQGDPVGIGPGFQSRKIDMVGDRVDAWQRWRLPMAAWRDGVDLLHCPANTCPSWMPTDTMVTIHDLIPIDSPQGRPVSHVRRFAESVRTACQSAAGLICPSRYTADRLINEYNADPQTISVIPWAPDSSVAHVPEDQWGPVLKRYEITRPYVLHFGAAAPRKNTRRLIAAWAMIDPVIRNDWQLVIVGLDRQTYRRMVLHVESLDLEEQVKLYGFAKEQDVPTLLSASSILAYPSQSEGFGLPILDAWVTGTAVLSGDQTSLPEIAGDAALLVDPSDSVCIAEGLEGLIDSESDRHELVRRGRSRVQSYTWQKTATAFATAIEAAAARVDHHRLAAA